MGAGFEPAYAMRADLQSAAFNHSATPPGFMRHEQGHLTNPCHPAKSPFEQASRRTEGRLIVTNNSPRNRAKLRKSERRTEERAGPIWLWGNHACDAALANPIRKVHRRVATDNAVRRLGLRDFEPIDPKGLDRLLPKGAVHQGVAIEVDPLEPKSIEEVIDLGLTRIAVLDQVADPHNLGAIYRSAAAFGVEAMVLQTRHAPPITGIVAKAAAGAIETVLEVRVVNIARTLEALKRAAFLTVGLAGEGTVPVETACRAEKLALVLGAEGSGLRPAVAKACDLLTRIEISPQMESLNVSTAAAITFYVAEQSNRVPERS